MYYYFLGRFLAHNRGIGGPIVNEMCKDSHREENYLTLLFAIHHTADISIVDNILLQTMCTLDSVAPAALDREETRRFSRIVVALPENILSAGSVEEQGPENATARMRWVVGQMVR